jgi:hypothetical protein
MYSLQSKSDWIKFIPRRVKARIYIYIYMSEITLILTNAHEKQNDVILELKTRYIVWPVIKYTIHSFQSKCDWMIFIPRRVKARLYIYFTIKFSRNESPREIKQCYPRTQNALYAVASSKVP